MEQNSNGQTQKRGIYFSKKVYQDSPIIPFSEARNLLPEPIYEGNPDYIDCYWRSWELAYQNTYSPTKESGFVSNFIDAAFNHAIFMWDTAFITMFCNIGHPFIPGIRSLDNFYCKQFDDGEIPREIIRKTGDDCYRWVNNDRKPLHSYFHNHYKHRGLKNTKTPSYHEMFKPKLGRDVEIPPYLTLDNLNHPIIAWAELESFRQTGDTDRLELVWEPLVKYFGALNYHLLNHFGLFVTDWASMDNSPRNIYLGSGVDISCEMALFANSLLEIADILVTKFKGQGNHDLVERVESDTRILAVHATKIAKEINERMWDPDSGFYYDLTDSGEQAPIKTVAAYWALLGQVADQGQSKRLVDWLNDPKTFKRVHRVPTLAADEPDYNPNGGYWRGSVWAPTNTMVIRGLEKYGYDELAREIAINHLDNIVQVYKETGTIWENYPPDSISSGDADKKDFVGWSGIAPILYFIEYVIGIRGNALKNEITWKIKSPAGEVGCKRYWFAGRTIHLRAVHKKNGSIYVEAESDGPLTLKIYSGTREKTIELNGGAQFEM